MNIYEYQRSRSFFDLCPRSLRLLFSTVFCSNGTGPMEAKFYVGSLWDGRIKIWRNGPGHVTKMAAMHMVYG